MDLMWECEAPHRSLVYFENHASSQLNPTFIDCYISAEQAAGRYSRGYTPNELEQIIGPFQSAPLGLVPKPNSNRFRLVQDLSYPQNDPLFASVNASIDSDKFPTVWGTFDSTAELILSLPPGCSAATFDISAAYRITPVQPHQQNTLCIFWRGLVYVDRALMFGLSSSAGVFGSIADMLVAIYGCAGFDLIRKWVDDFLVIRLPHQTWSENDFIALTAYCGVPWSLEKLRPLASVQHYIGFDWDLEKKTVAIPEEKLAKTRALVAAWLKADAKFSMRDACSLHGKLVHVSCVFPLIRPFLRGLSAFARNFHSNRARLTPSKGIVADLQWVADLLHLLPNEISLCSPHPVDIGWWGDASTSFGIGIVIGRFWAVWHWAPGFQVGPGRAFDIRWAEAVAVELGLCMALCLGLLVSQNRHEHLFLARSDNAGIVAVTNKGRSHNPATNIVLKSIFARPGTMCESVQSTSPAEKTSQTHSPAATLQPFWPIFPTRLSRPPFLCQTTSLPS